MLKSQNLTWSMLKVPDCESLPGGLKSQFAKALEQIFSETRTDLIALKDPRVCILLPIWMSTLEQMEVDIKYVYSLRHSHAVAKSIFKRNGLGLERGLLMWARYNIEVLNFFQRSNVNFEKVAFVEFPNWTSDPSVFYDKVQKSCGVEFPNSYSDVEEAVSGFVDPKLIHQNAGLEGCSRYLVELCDQLYIETIECFTKADADKSRLNEVIEKLTPLVNISGRLIHDERMLWLHRTRESMQKMTQGL